MPRLEDLRTSLTNMTPDELREKIRTIRADRRIPKDGVRKKKAAVAKVKKATKAKSASQKILETLSPEELQKLMQELDA